MKDLCSDMEQFGKGIGSVPRYRIVESLFSGPKTVKNLTLSTKLSQPLVSQHLRILKQTELVKAQRQGQEIWYSLNSEYTMNLLKRLLDQMRPKKKNLPN